MKRKTVTTSAPAPAPEKPTGGMKSIRLTNEMRDEIVDRALALAFPEDKDPVKNRELRIQLGLLVYRAMVSEEHQKMMEALPEGFMQRRDEIRVNTTSFINILGKSEGGSIYNASQFPLGKALPVPCDYGYHGGVEVPKNHPSYAPLLEHFKEVFTMRAKKKELREQVRALVYSATTTGKLFEQWPEAVALMDSSWAKDKKAPLPAVYTASINALVFKK